MLRSLVLDEGFKPGHWPNFPFYEELDSILGIRAASSPAVLLESSNTTALQLTGMKLLVNRHTVHVATSPTVTNLFLCCCIVTDSDSASIATVSGGPVTLGSDVGEAEEYVDDQKPSESVFGDATPDHTQGIQ